MARVHIICFALSLWSICQATTVSGEYQVREVLNRTRMNPEQEVWTDKCFRVHPNNKTIAYADCEGVLHIVDGVPVDTEWLMVVDGKRGPEYDDMSYRQELCLNS